MQFLPPGAPVNLWNISYYCNPVSQRSTSTLRDKFPTEPFSQPPTIHILRPDPDKARGPAKKIAKFAQSHSIQKKAYENTQEEKKFITQSQQSGADLKKRTTSINNQLYKTEPCKEFVTFGECH